MFDLVLETPVEPVRPPRARHVHGRLCLVREESGVVHLVFGGHGSGVVSDVELEVQHGTDDVGREPRSRGEERDVPREIQEDADAVDEGSGGYENGHEVQVQTSEEDAERKVSARLRSQEPSLPSRARFPLELSVTDEHVGFGARGGIVVQHVGERVVGEMISPPPRRTDASGDRADRPSAPEREIAPPDRRSV